MKNLQVAAVAVVGMTATIGGSLGCAFAHAPGTPGEGLYAALASTVAVTGVILTSVAVTWLRLRK